MKISAQHLLSRICKYTSQDATHMLQFGFRAGNVNIFILYLKLNSLYILNAIKGIICFHEL